MSIERDICFATLHRCPSCSTLCTAQACDLRRVNVKRARAEIRLERLCFAFPSCCITHLAFVHSADMEGLAVHENFDGCCHCDDRFFDPWSNCWLLEAENVAIHILSALFTPGVFFMKHELRQCRITSRFTRTAKKLTLFVSR